MRPSRSYQPRSASDNRSDYEQLFIRCVHELVKLGYDRLCASAYATQEETVITGELVEAIEGILEYPSENWMRVYRVYDDPPINEIIKTTRKIDQALAAPPKSFGLQAQRNNFQLFQISAQLHHTYISEHRRTTDGKRLQIYHSLLIFH